VDAKDFYRRQLGAPRRLLFGVSALTWLAGEMPCAAQGERASVNRKA